MTDPDPADAVVEAIAGTANEIREGLVGRRGKRDEENPSGELQAEADVFADELLAERILAIDGVSQYASEEQPEILNCGDEGLSVAVDPLDGTSNLPSNNPIGTVFGIYDEPLPAPGTALVAAGYVIYGPITTMTCARDGTVTRSELSGDEWTVVCEDVTIPDDHTIYGFGGRVPDWTDDFDEYAREIRSDLELRYCGAMIADVDAVITLGGIYSYPALRGSPRGKLRLQFEGNPIGYVVETAGGRSSDGTRSLLEVDPVELHDRVPLHVGSSGLVERLEAALA